MPRLSAEATMLLLSCLIICLLLFLLFYLLVHSPPHLPPGYLPHLPSELVKPTRGAQEYIQFKLKHSILEAESSKIQEMDDRVKSMLKIIEADADTFSKKAEIYFKKRPELIKFVEETYRAYRALAERYDHISGELHKANHTIVNAFPDQVQFDTQDEDDDHLPKAITSINFSRLNRLAIDISEDSLINNVKENFDKLHLPPMIARGKAPEEIERIQKEILVLQTEKEFIRSSYENSIARYQEIEALIAAMQEQLFLLQDEFSESIVIDDEEARTLMATAALRSCEDTIVNLQEKQKRSAQLTRMGSRRILMAKEKLKSFKGDPGVNKIIFEESDDRHLDAATEEFSEPKQELIQISPDMSVVELAERINELVNKVITLELTTSSQNAQIENLRIETDELHKHVESLEEEKFTLIEGSSSLSNRLVQTEKELHEIQDIKKLTYAAKGDDLRCADDACLHVTANSEKPQSAKHEEANFVFTSQEKETTLLNMEPPRSQEKETKGNDGMYVSFADETKEIQGKVANTSLVAGESGTQLVEKDDFPGLLQSLFNGAKDKEKILLTEYTSILRNYKQIKKRLSEVEKKNQDYVFETTTRLLELKKANDVKDEKLRLMQQMLTTMQTNPDENELKVSNEVDSSGQRDSMMLASTNAEYLGLKDAASETTDTLHTTSPVVEKFRRDIDVLLDENLDFWLRFSTSFQQIQKFQMEFDDLQAAFKTMACRSTELGSDRFSADSGSIDKQLRELKTELQVWLEQNNLLRGELQSRFSSLCNIKDDISGALAENLESDKAQFSPYEAAKFQGEVSNMQQENNKVADELQTGLDHVRELRAEVEKTLSEIHEKNELSSSAGSQHFNRPFKHFPLRPRMPLRNFLFGVRPKKKPSIFRCVDPTYQKQYSDLSSGFS